MSIPVEALTLSPDNYYSNEADWKYMSNSQFKSWLQCEARTLAELKGEWERSDSDAMAIGRYVHAAMEGEEALAKFEQENPQMYSSRGPTKGQLKAEYQQAKAMIQTLLNDKLIVEHFRGLKEHIVEGIEFAGALWKAKFDVYMPERWINDLKTVSNLKAKEWMADHYEPWITAYGYITQLSIYAELERLYAERDTWLDLNIIAVTKEKVPDKGIYSIDADSIAEQLEFVEAQMPRILAVKSGEVEPEACGVCDYCKSHKQLTEVTDYRELVI